MSGCVIIDDESIEDESQSSLVGNLLLNTPCGAAMAAFALENESVVLEEDIVTTKVVKGKGDK